MGFVRSPLAVTLGDAWFLRVAFPDTNQRRQTAPGILIPSAVIALPSYILLLRYAILRERNEKYLRMRKDPLYREAEAEVYAMLRETDS